MSMSTEDWRWTGLFITLLLLILENVTRKGTSHSETDRIEPQQPFIPIYYSSPHDQSFFGILFTKGCCLYAALCKLSPFLYFHATVIRVRVCVYVTLLLHVLYP